jgi:hypothetical protein
MLINELERMGKEAGVSCFKVLSQYFPEGSEENDGKPLDIPCPDWDSNRATRK